MIEAISLPLVYTAIVMKSCAMKRRFLWNHYKKLFVSSGSIVVNFRCSLATIFPHIFRQRSKFF